MAENPEAYRPIVRNVSITPEGIGIEYTIPALDGLPNGLMFNHYVFLPDDTYDEMNATIRTALKIGVQQALKDAANPKNSYHLPPDDIEEDDSVGPYEYPPGQGPGAGNGTDDRQARTEAVAPAEGAAGPRDGT
jgi:hypothetical protein